MEVVPTLLVLLRVEDLLHTEVRHCHLVLLHFGVAEIRNRYLCQIYSQEVLDNIKIDDVLLSLANTL